MKAPPAAASTLSPAERARLVNVLGRLASEHLGERAAAGLLASRLLTAKGLSWSEVIVGVPAYEPPPGCARDWRSDAAFCLKHFIAFSEWEAEFLGNLLRRRTPPTPRQVGVLNDLFARAVARATQRGTSAPA